MSTVALIVHENRADARYQAGVFREWLNMNDHSLVMLQDNAETLGLEVETRSRADFAKDVDLVVSLGGDGSMLRAVRLAALHDVAVLGINFGTLGYLTEVAPQDMLEAVEATLAGKCVIDKRLRVQVSLQRSTGERSVVGYALNEALVERDESGRTIRLQVSVDGTEFMTYTADGVIVASPTGSTAYSLSAGGPLVAPLHEALIVTPVSPHQLIGRSLVLNPSCQVELRVVGDRPASLSIDGRSLERLRPGDRVFCTASDIPAKLVSLSGHSFLNVVKSKFGISNCD